jgi:hypothetical protein
MPTRQLCECGYRNARRAWECDACDRMTAYTKRRIGTFFLSLVVAALTVVYVQTVVRSVVGG